MSELSKSPASCGPLTRSRAIEAGAAFTAASPTALGGQPAAAAAIDEAAAAAFVAAEEEEMREMESQYETADPEVLTPQRALSYLQIILRFMQLLCENHNLDL